jgi:hypothetical protein
VCKSPRSERSDTHKLAFIEDSVRLRTEQSLPQSSFPDFEFINTSTASQYSGDGSRTAARSHVMRTFHRQRGRSKTPTTSTTSSGASSPILSSRQRNNIAPLNLIPLSNYSADSLDSEGEGNSAPPGTTSHTVSLGDGDGLSSSTPYRQSWNISGSFSPLPDALSKDERQHVPPFARYNSEAFLVSLQAVNLIRRCKSVPSSHTP